MIVAIATPIGEGGISVVRVSGGGACQAVDHIFKGKHTLASSASHTAHFGMLTRRNGEAIDQVVATIFSMPGAKPQEEVLSNNSVEDFRMN
jgi:tRNA modification GTPase